MAVGSQANKNHPINSKPKPDDKNPEKNKETDKNKNSFFENNQKEDIDNFEEDNEKSKADDEAASEEFKQISNYLTEENVHMIRFGISLSKNHPILKDQAFHDEMREKIKGIKLSVDEPNVSLFIF